MHQELSVKNQLRITLLSVIALLVLAATDSFADTSGYSLDSSYRKLVTDYPAIEPVRLQPDAPVRHWPDRVFRHGAGGPLRIEVFAPAAAGPRPGLLLVHGGGWRSGDRQLLAPLAQRLAARGFVVASTDYRLSGEAPFPAPVHDLFDALHWLRANAGEFGLDPARLAIGGASAGGQLAALVGLANGDPALNPGAEPPVLAIINIDGLWDFTTPLALRYENDPAKPQTAASAYLGGRFEQLPARWRQASPINYLHRQAPALMSLTGENPRFSAGIDTLAAQAQPLGLTFEHRHYPGAPHSFWLFRPWFDLLVPQLEQFLLQVFETSGGL